VEFYDPKASLKIGFAPYIDGVLILLVLMGLVFGFSRGDLIPDVSVVSGSVTSSATTVDAPAIEEGQQTPEVLPEAAPGETVPEVVPEASPEATTEAMTEVAPEIEPEAIPEVVAEPDAVSVVDPVAVAEVLPSQLTEAEYVTQLSEEFAASLQYPDIAKSRGWQGETLISIKLSKQGALRLVRVDKTSGHALLDQAAVAAVRQAVPVSAPPVGLSDIVVPIVFALP